MSELTDESLTEAPVTAEVKIHPDDPDDEWSAAEAGHGLRLRALTAALAALLVLAGGFWGGAVAEKHHAGSSSGSSALSAIASRLAAARGAAGTGGTGATGGFTGAGGFAGAGSSAASGIVTGVQGNILYVTDSTGALVKVVVSSSVPVTRTAKSSLTGLQTGDTVIVQGTKASSGEVTATAVRATGQGVNTTGGGGAGLFSGRG